jgi:hypothetical protein
MLQRVTIYDLKCRVKGLYCTKTLPMEGTCSIALDKSSLNSSRRPLSIGSTSMFGCLFADDEINS